MIASALWTAAATATQNPPAAPVTARAAAEIETLRRQASVPLPAPVFLIAEDAGLASALALLLPDHSFATPGHPPVFVPESPYADSQYALWPRYDQFVPAPPTTPDDAPDPFTEQDGVNPFLGRSAFFVTSQAPADLPQSITAAFASCRLLAEISGPSGTTLRVYLCSDYQTLPL
jgi:hypothetical protein